ncbi:MAG: SpoIIE family protein phosphatase, partial [Verrucomicrobia bacterium]|nr:SpoIIE family protein phosphatase [Verrucomicrobiota bacterium]
VEETRLFDFLHGLGSAFSGKNIRASDLHRLIVEGAARILDANGGALYLVDRTGSTLVPTFLSKGCPPLVNVPKHILQQAEVTPMALDSYLRLHPVNKEDGLLARVWQKQEPLFLPSLAQDGLLVQLQGGSKGKTESVIAAPLSYADQKLGVLALANGPQGRAFTLPDFEVFKSIAEQSAFALYNAIVYSEVNEKKNLDRDLEIARDIQRILLPAASPEVPGFEIAGINVPARQVSGDYYDYLTIDDQHFGVAIADVSGKGVPASLIMAMCRSVLRSQAPHNPSAADALRKVNRQLFPDMKEDMFISMAYAILDHAAGELSFCRAGHDAPLLYSAATGKVVKINPPGMALGIDSGTVFDRLTRNTAVPLEHGDCFILYTDGITEALDENGQEYGLERMNSVVQASAPEGAATVVKRLTDDVRAFCGNQPQNDDITLIVIRKV